MSKPVSTSEETLTELLLQIHDRYGRDLSAYFDEKESKLEEECDQEEPLLSAELSRLHQRVRG